MPPGIVTHFNAHYAYWHENLMRMARMMTLFCVFIGESFWTSELVPWRRLNAVQVSFTATPCFVFPGSGMCLRSDEPSS